MDNRARQNPADSSWSKDQKLLNAYLYETRPVTPHPNPPHSLSLPPTEALRAGNMHRLHMRRTLDQYYHYTLQHTQERDEDQVVSRAHCQKDRPPEARVLTMVDQLWLWAITGRGDQPDTIVTCFPERYRPPKEKSDVTGTIPFKRGVDAPNDPAKIVEDPDELGSTDVISYIKVHLLDEPSSVKSSHDLARLIASKCSRAYMDTGSSEEQLRFPELYEIAIGDVVSPCIFPPD